MAANPPPENLRYPFGRAVPVNFRWKGKFTTYDEQWWREYGEAMEEFAHSRGGAPTGSAGHTAAWRPK